MNIPLDKVKRVLVVRLRSIGDTVLATPSLTALRRALPDAEIDILLEDQIAPVLDDLEGINVITTTRKGSKLPLIRELRRRKYDIAFNLHGGTTSALITFAGGARYRVGYADYQYSFLYNVRCMSSAQFWGRGRTHSAEQQLALLGQVGIDVSDRPKTRLCPGKTSIRTVNDKLKDAGIDDAPFALIHPATAFFTKQWAPENFARVAEYLSERGIAAVAISSKAERPTLDKMIAASSAEIIAFDDLSLPEVIALAARARVFVGNDSGIAHIAAAVQTPSVVIFGSSSRDHWRPWTDAPHQIVFSEFECQPCPGYRCEVYGEPRCILSVDTTKVLTAIEKLI